MCNCIEETNKKLKEHPEWNTVLDIPITWNTKGQLGADKILVKTRKDNEKIRKGPINLFPSYCPFCGKKYEEPKP